MYQKTTVSRVLNNTGPVKEETKKIIEESMKLLDYSPSYFAKKKNRNNINYFVNLSKKIPVIFMDNVLWGNEDVPYVLTEGFQSTCDATKYLYSKGSKRIAYLRIPSSISVIHHRYEGYKKGITELGMEVDGELVYQFENENDSISHLDVGREAAKYFMELDNHPDTIMAATDTMAVGIIMELKEMNVKIPEEMSVVRFDNIMLSEIVEPKLTTISQPIKELGIEAAKIVMSILGGQKEIEHQKIMKPEFIIRDSTK